MVIINWKVWFVPDLDFEKLEGMGTQHFYREEAEPNNRTNNMQK